MISRGGEIGRPASPDALMLELVDRLASGASVRKNV